MEDLILKTDAPVSLNYVQDLDGDQLPADVEYFLRTSDSPLPFGAIVPGSTSFDPTDPDSEPGPGESVKFNSDPGLATGSLVRVTDSGGGLIAGQNYYVRALGEGSYSFYDELTNATNTDANTDPLNGRIPLTGEITAGIFSPTAAVTPTFTDFTNQSVIFDPGYATGTIVNVTNDSGGLLALKPNPEGPLKPPVPVDYFVRNLGGGSYSFYETVADAIFDENEVDLTSEVTVGIFNPTPKGRDTDRDGLDDRFEALIGWTVSTPLKTYTVYSSPNRRDSNVDNPKLGVNSDNDYYDAEKTKPRFDREEFDGSDFNVAPAGWNDKLTVDTDGDGRPDAPNGLRDRFEVYQIDAKDWVLDPIRKDTDGDGINDATEIIGFQITSIEDGSLKPIDHTDPLTPFTDSDTFTDGFEKYIGLDPTDGRDTDEDGDGLPDLLEYKGWVVYSFAFSTKPWKQGAYAVGYGGTNLSLTPASTHLGSDVVEFNVSNAPSIQQATLVEVTGGGLTANSPYYLGRLREQSNSAVVQYRLYESAVDAILGTARGAEDLKTSAITSLKVLASKVSSIQSVDTDGDSSVVRMLSREELAFLSSNRLSDEVFRADVEQLIHQRVILPLFAKLNEDKHESIERPFNRECEDLRGALDTQTAFLERHNISVDEIGTRLSQAQKRLQEFSFSAPDSVKWIRDQNEKTKVFGDWELEIGDVLQRVDLDLEIASSESVATVVRFSWRAISSW